MCGICGYLNTRISTNVDKEMLADMAATLKHRGPDDFGTYTDASIGLAHRRLKIIDLTTAGKQPMCSPDKCYWIVLNGEIYNYIELKRYLMAKGHQFYTHTDTEVLLHLLVEDGIECLQKLNGMFAFAFWDRIARKLILARDRLGIKPLYWFQDSDKFIFASEIKAILKGNNTSAELQPNALQDYLTFQFCLGDKTLFKGIHKLEPGTWMQIDTDGNKNTHPYWQLNFEIDQDHSEDYFVSRLHSLLVDSVKLRLRSDVPVGAHLSGGLDSSAITSLAANEMNTPIHSFTGGFPDFGKRFDETGYARMVADEKRTQHHEIYPTAADFVDLLPRIIYHMDEPAAGPGIFPQVMVAKLAKQHVSVVLGGQGGDEIFAGYARYLVAYLEECIRGAIEGTNEDPGYVVNFRTIFPNLPELNGYQPLMKHFWEEGLFNSQAERYFRLINRGNIARPFINKELFAGCVYDPYQAYLDVYKTGEPASFINRMTRFDIKTILPALLHVEDRTSTMFSLESRVPLLDHRIVELAASMPPRYKFAGGHTKSIFRKAIQNVVPNAILDRQEKMGFPVPLSDWYQQEPVRSFIRDVLLSSKAKTRNWFDAQAVERTLQQERLFGRTIWGLLCLELWANTFLDGSSDI